jgi:YgiT-type zinc finger domain-containing protein
MHANSPYICPRCQIGHLQRGQATFITCVDDQLLSIPDVDAWACDICHYREFDATAIRQIELITGAFVTPLEIAPQPTRPASGETPPTTKATA